MALKDKWKMAQQCETRYWLKRLPPEAFPENALSLTKFEYDNRSYAEAAEKIYALIGSHKRLNGREKVLQIGCGPLDIVHFWKSEVKYGLDSLMDFYRATYLLPEKYQIHCVAAEAERFDLPETAFDVVLAVNVLDHTHDVRAVLRNAHRVLKEDGLFYSSTNTYTLPGYALRKMLSPFGVDRAHTYTFMKRHIDRLLAQCGFRVVGAHCNTKKYQYRIMRDSGVGILKLLAGCHIPVFHYITLCRKVTPGRKT